MPANPAALRRVVEAARHCMDCGAGITLCMGAVLARDFDAALQGNLSWTAVRERCGRCVLRIQLSGEVPDVPRNPALIDAIAAVDAEEKNQS